MCNFQKHFDSPFMTTPDQACRPAKPLKCQDHVRHRFADKTDDLFYKCSFVACYI